MIKKNDSTLEKSSSTKHATNIVSKSSPIIDSPEKGPSKVVSPKEIQVLKYNKISINYIHTGEILDWNKIVINNIFAFKVVFDITRNDDEI